MPKFIDIHCHILPNVDDGPAAMSEALELARLLLEKGFTDIVATPHYRQDFSLQYRELVKTQYIALQTEIKNAQLPLNLHLGGEVTLTPEALQAARDDKLPTINNTNYLLLELPFASVPPLNLHDSIFTLQTLGYQIILAHPERMEFFKTKPKLITALTDKQVMLQINAGSLAGTYGKTARKIAEQLLAENMVHFISSDCHTTNCVTAITKISTKYKDLLPIHMGDLPHHVICGEPVYLPARQHPKKLFSFKRFFTS